MSVSPSAIRPTSIRSYLAVRQTVTNTTTKQGICEYTRCYRMRPGAKNETARIGTRRSLASTHVLGTTHRRMS